MERMVLTVVVLAVIGVGWCTACDMDKVHGCEYEAYDNFTIFFEKYDSGSWSEEKFNQKICGQLEIVRGCLATALAGCPKHTIRQKNEWITRVSEEYTCEEQVTVAVGTIVSSTVTKTVMGKTMSPITTQWWMTFPTTNRRRQVTRRRQDAETTNTRPQVTPGSGWERTGPTEMDVTNAERPEKTTNMADVERTTISMATRGRTTALLVMGAVTVAMVSVCY